MPIFKRCCLNKNRKQAAALVPTLLSIFESGSLASAAILNAPSISEMIKASKIKQFINLVGNLPAAKIRKTQVVAKLLVS